ncbi:hypothetical protein CNBJ0030 [Cryptococcus deneoformans B-3501A]|uniref:Expressed protein n=1 Tax=Cryptococcus deneoformans (strain JEC21 / ATCC MYA-565) TaxID=214684 RepID=Q5KA15_CRYD1|nr:expressed protein [Cryptococcus neoformans var. neoformans JEC21]XP_773224.1 hypothetical protein CNBJ0030 [Cryptococcus neoformans var. neoformans B-3501A]AAW45903.1 expressed protein [Cryptococcus neoformans var. neoformans JEC21]EAL18577.1 hypothetical protein CNBJ0030 [Cryptococcus neoformans var. neoformans B-3501A]
MRRARNPNQQKKKKKKKKQFIRNPFGLPPNSRSKFPNTFPFHSTVLPFPSIIDSVVVLLSIRSPFARFRADPFPFHPHLATFSPILGVCLVACMR